MKYFRDYPNQEDELLIHGIVDGYLEEKIISISVIFKTDFILHPDDPAEIDAIVKNIRTAKTLPTSNDRSTE